MGEAGTYNILVNDDPNGIGGATGLMPGEGDHSYWITYISVPDTDATVAKATSLGGEVVAGPFDVPGVGRMAFTKDSQGAYFAVMTNEPGMPADTATSNFKGGKGNPVWNELMVADPAAAAKFYGDLLGWTNYVADMGTGPYTLLKNELNEVGGVFQFPEGMTMPYWMPYFEIERGSADAVAARIKELGGTVGMGPFEVPTVGKIIALSDPTGAWFGVIDPAPEWSTGGN
jgi:predicted enzyme related to lactoylglutathione lyase